MVEQIYDIDKLKVELNDGHAASIQLTEYEIKEWKESGKFAFLKKELSILPRIKFSCTKLDNGNCIYYFIANTPELMDRIHTMLYTLYYGNDRLSLVRCVEKYSSDGVPNADGTPQSCMLF